MAPKKNLTKNAKAARNSFDSHKYVMCADDNRLLNLTKDAEIRKNVKSRKPNKTTKLAVTTAVAEKVAGSTAAADMKLCNEYNVILNLIHEPHKHIQQMPPLLGLPVKQPQFAKHMRKLRSAEDIDMELNDIKWQNFTAENFLEVHKLHWQQLKRNWLLQRRNYKQQFYERSALLQLLYKK